MLFLIIGGRLVRTRTLRIDVSQHDFKIEVKERAIPSSPEREARIIAFQKHYSQPDQRCLLGNW